MSLFKPAQNESAFLKLGLMGSTGSGKTFTACLIARGVVELARERRLPYADKPVMFIDSENGSDYVRDVFDEAGIQLLVAKTKSFADLCMAMKEAEAGASFLIVDSVSAYWDEWKTTYQRQKNRSRLQFEDFAAIKTKWREGFTDRFINSKLHIAMCGRLAFEYDYTVDEETGKKNLEKTDVKMAAEKELGYETSLYVMMERDRDLNTGRTIRTATVIKDRFRTLDGQTFESPTFRSFAPHILKLNLAGEHRGVDLTRTSAELVPADAKRENYGIRRQIVVDELAALLEEHGAGGQSADAKAKRLGLMRKHFKTVSKTEIEELMPLVDLQASFDSLHRELTGQPSRYGVKEAPPPTDDAIPFLEADPAAEAVPTPEAPAAKDEKPCAADLDALTQRIILAISKAANATMLRSVIKANQGNRKLLTEAQCEVIDIAIDEANRRLAAKPVHRAAAIAEPLAAGAGK